MLFEKSPGEKSRHLAPAAPAATLRADDVESNDQGGRPKTYPEVVLDSMILMKKHKKKMMMTIHVNI